MSGSDTHADTPGASLDELFQPRWQTYRDLAAAIPETDPPHPAAGVASMLTCASHDVEQLRDEVGRERARADAAEVDLGHMRNLHDWRAKEGEQAREELQRERARADRAEAALERVRAVEWREEVDSNGEYTTERYRNASSVRAEIEDALSASSPPPVPTAALTEALSWALDVLEISLKRLDKIEEQPYSDEHLRLRDAGLAKARAALSAGSGGRETTSETPDTKGRIYELAAEVARLVCVEDVPYVESPDGDRALDLAANELGYLLKLDEPEFKDIWRDRPKSAGGRETT